MTVQLQSHFTEAAKPARPPRKRPPRPISVRVTHEEREALEAEAGEQTLSAYVRSILLGTPGNRRRYQKRPELDRVALARILAVLGQLGIAPDFKVIAEAARTGTLECGPELLAKLEQTCRDIMLMRSDLIRALGIKAE